MLTQRDGQASGYIDIIGVYAGGGVCYRGVSMCRNGPSYGTEEMYREW
jgi:hypothetical protein